MTTSKWHGLIFKDFLVRELLAGNKTQTLRLPTAQNSDAGEWSFDACDPNAPDRRAICVFDAGAQAIDVTSRSGEMRRLRPRIRAGDVIWVRETHRFAGPGNAEVVYRATDKDSAAVVDSVRWRPSIHMPRWACRAAMKITAVRAHRLHDMTPAELFGEGIPRNVGGPSGDIEAAHAYFREGWDAMHPKHPYSSNPVVWRYAWNRVFDPSS